MDNEQDTSNNTSFLYMLFCMLFTFIFLFLIQIYKKDDVSKKNVESTAEFLITVKWPDNNVNDVDVYCEDPLGHIVHFQSKTDGFMMLEWDDLGMANDTLLLPNGDIIKSPINDEKVTIRQIIEGEYILNVHMFTKRNLKETPITVTIEKLNPYKIAFRKTVVLTHNGEETTVTRFTLDKNGELVSTNDLPKSFTRIE